MANKQRKLQINGNPQKDNFHFINSGRPPKNVFRDS